MFLVFQGKSFQTLSFWLRTFPDQELPCDHIIYSKYCYTNNCVIGLPLFSGTSFPECPPSPMLPHPMSENSCDSHSLARNTSTGTFLKTQATTWTKQLQKNENSTTHESSACLTHQHSSKKKQASTHRLFQNHTSTTSSTVIKNNALCPPHCNKEAKQQHLRAPCTSGADRNGPKRRKDTAMQQLFDIVTSNYLLRRSATPL